MRPLLRRAVPDDHGQGRPVDGAHADGGGHAGRQGLWSWPGCRRLSRKPLHFPELVLRIRALARRRSATRGRVLRAAGIELDPIRRTVSRDGRQLDLSVKEFGVLEALLLDTPAFLRAEDLLERVWDEQADPFTNTVTVTIG